MDPATLDLDEKYYRSAEKLYFDEKCPQAIGAFGDYLNKYPNGAFALNAQYYRGDCLYRAGNYDQALARPGGRDRGNGATSSWRAPCSVPATSCSATSDGKERWTTSCRLETVASFPQNTLAAQVGQMRALQELGRARKPPPPPRR